SGPAKTAAKGMCPPPRAGSRPPAMPQPTDRPETASNAPVLITMGEPAGIGPEIAVAAYRKLGGHIGARALKLVGDPDVFRAFGALPDDALIDSGPLQARCAPGKPDSINTRAVTDAIDVAVKRAMAGAAAAVVTAPINKAVLMAGGFQYPGHTEYLAALTGAARAVMMLAGGGLRVVPLTVHMPLANVPKTISTVSIVKTGEIVLHALKH